MDNLALALLMIEIKKIEKVAITISVGGSNFAEFIARGI